MLTCPRVSVWTRCPGGAFVLPPLVPFPSAPAPVIHAPSSWCLIAHCPVHFSNVSVFFPQLIIVGCVSKPFVQTHHLMEPSGGQVVLLSPRCGGHRWPPRLTAPEPVAESSPQLLCEERDKVDEAPFPGARGLGAPERPSSEQSTDPTPCSSLLPGHLTVANGLTYQPQRPTAQLGRIQGERFQN